MKIKLDIYGPDGGFYNGIVEYVGVDEKHKVYELWYVLKNDVKIQTENINIENIDFEHPIQVLDNSHNKHMSINNIVDWFDLVGKYDVILPEGTIISNDVADTMLYFIEKYHLFNYIEKKLINNENDSAFKVFPEKKYHFNNHDRKDSSSLVFYNENDVFIFETKLYDDINHAGVLMHAGELINDKEMSSMFFDNNIRIITSDKMHDEVFNEGKRYIIKEMEKPLNDRVNAIKKFLKKEDSKIVSRLFHFYIEAINLLYRRYNGDLIEIEKHIHPYLFTKPGNNISVLKRGDKIYEFKDDEFACYDKYVKKNFIWLYSIITEIKDDMTEIANSMKSNKLVNDFKYNNCNIDELIDIKNQIEKDV